MNHREHDKVGKHVKNDAHSKGNHDKHGNDNHMDKNQIELVRRCNEMLQIVQNQDKNKLYVYKSTGDKQEVVNLRQQMANCINTTMFTKNVTDPGPSQPNSVGNCKITLSHLKAIQCARELHIGGLNKIAVMSFASPHDQGGPFKKGILTQETSIVSQTLLLGSLLSSKARPFYIIKSPHQEKSKDKDKTHKNNLDALDNGIIYSPSVPVVTDGKANFYNSENVFYIDVISVSPVKIPQRPPPGKSGHGHKDKNGKSGHSDQSIQAKAAPIMEKKIRDTIYVAASVKADALVLGAFGCGRSGNDPRIISKIFEKILFTEGYAGHFKQIIFAIPGKNIYDTFNDCFKLYITTNENATKKADEPEINEEEAEGEEESQSQDSYSENSDDDSKNDEKETENDKKQHDKKVQDDDKKKDEKEAENDKKQHNKKDKKTDKDKKVDKKADKNKSDNSKDKKDDKEKNEEEDIC